MVMEIVISVVLLVVGIAVLVTIHVCIVGRAFGRTLRTNDGSIMVQRSGTVMMGRSESMSQDDIQKLPCYDFKLEGEAKDQKISVAVIKTVDCAVCLENFNEGDKCRLLPKCNHSFHAQCIDSWLIKTGACPICRTFADFKTRDAAESSFSGEVSLELR